jgi:hypothetical protein
MTILTTTIEMQKITHFELLSNEIKSTRRKTPEENKKRIKYFHPSKPLSGKVLNEPGVDERIW